MKKSKCAICGGELEFVREEYGICNDREVLIRCKCNKCGIVTRWESDKIQAILSWNNTMKRIKNGEYPEVVKQYKEKLKNVR